MTVSKHSQDGTVTCFGHLLYPSSGVLYCTFGTGKFHAGFLRPFPSRVRMERSKIWIISASGWLLKRNLSRCTVT